jgi:hypothetical protein
MKERGICRLWKKKREKKRKKKHNFVEDMRNLLLVSK